MNKNFSLKFWVLFCAVLLSVILLTGCLKHFLDSSPSLIPLLSMQYLHVLGSYFLLGPGIGLPAVLIASMFGWIQFILLMYGDIQPHLGRQGFFRVLGTLLIGRP